MTSNILQDPATLRALGETPADVQARLTRELDAFGEALQSREGDWQRQQPGRDWSPAQETEHVMKVNGAVASVLRLLLSDRPLRPGEQAPGELRDGKRQAPVATMPSETGTAWAEVEAHWQASRAALEAQAAQVRETPGRTVWHPFFGELDALDWLRMGVYHIGHHRRLMAQSAPNTEPSA